MQAIIWELGAILWIIGQGNILVAMLYLSVAVLKIEQENRLGPKIFAIGLFAISLALAISRSLYGVPTIGPILK